MSARTFVSVLAAADLGIVAISSVDSTSTPHIDKLSPSQAEWLGQVLALNHGSYTRWPVIPTEERIDVDIVSDGAALLSFGKPARFEVQIPRSPQVWTNSAREARRNAQQAKDGAR